MNLDWLQCPLRRDSVALAFHLQKGRLIVLLARSTFHQAQILLRCCFVIDWQPDLMVQVVQALTAPSYRELVVRLQQAVQLSLLQRL